MTVARIAFLGALGANVAALVWTHPATAEDGSTIPPSAPPPSTQPAPVAPPTAEDPAPPAFEPSSDAEPPNVPTTAPARDPAPAPASSAAPAPATIAEPPTVPKAASTVPPAATTSASAPAHSLGTVRPPLAPTATRGEAVSAQNASRKTEAAPLEVQRTQEPNGAVGAGVLIFAISYLPATMFAQSSTAHIDELLYVPLAGPWLDLARRPMCVGNACNTEFGNRALLVTDGMLQDFGFLLTLAGLLSSEAAASTQTAKVVETPARKVRVSPAQFGAGGYGIAAFGKF